MLRNALKKISSGGKFMKDRIDAVDNVLFLSMSGTDAIVIADGDGKLQLRHFTSLVTPDGPCHSRAMRALNRAAPDRGRAKMLSHVTVSSRPTARSLPPARGEKVGMRGRCRRARLGAQNSRATHSPSLRSTSLPARGAGEPSVMRLRATPPHPSFARPPNPPKKGGGAPTGAPSVTASSDAAARLALKARSPLGAPPRLSPEASARLAQLQAMLPGTRIPRALPAFTYPSPGTAPPAPA